jgi:hypothetical protein
MSMAPSLNRERIYLKLPRMAGASAHTLALAAIASVAVAASPVSDRDLRAVTDGLLVEVGALRKIAPRGALERRLVTRGEARAERNEAVAAATGPEAVARARLWERLGLLPKGTDVARLATTILDAAPTASYDPARRRLSVPDWIPLVDQRTALAHAIEHALADQRFGLRDLLQIDAEGRHHLDSDAERARVALIEGDASVAAFELADARGAFGGGHERPVLAAAIAQAPAADAPAWIRANVDFAHADGFAFVARVRGRQPWSAVDALWAAPPRSSEQILHPEKYDAHDAPVAVEPPKATALGDGWRVEASDVLGELGVRTWLAAAVPAEIAERAAAGWGGDRATLFVTDASSAPDAGAHDGGGASSDGGAPLASCVSWTTVWDDVTDADDFARTAPRVLARLAGIDDAPPPDERGRTIIRGDAGVFALARKANAVALLIAGPESALPVLEVALDRAPPPARRKTARPPTPPARR